MNGSAPAGGEGAEVTVLIPTRHEKPNIGPLLDRLWQHFDETGRSWEVLFVDDSDDDTPEEIRDHARDGHPVRVHHRPAGTRGGGLAGALSEGMARAHGSVIVVMDADLQHPPEVVERLVAPLLDGPADVAVGSRYSAGGSAQGLAGLWRRWVSVASRRVVQLLFPEVRRSSDPGGGLFAVRREVVQGVPLAATGYKMLVEVLVRGTWEVLVDVPYEFGQRQAGTTKSTLIQGWRMMEHVVALWWDTRVRRSGSS